MKQFIPLIIIEGATVMAVELCGAKLMAPLYGGSLFVWAAILAITLSALAFGYYFGGVISHKDKVDVRLYKIIAFASVLIALMPFLSIYVLPYIAYIDFKLAVLSSAFLLIFFPIFLLGCTTPLFIRINTHSVETAGLVSGKVYAISTVGGIVSTLLCGFVLIPFVGLKTTLIIFSILLFTTATIVLKIFKLNSTLVLLLASFFSVKVQASSGNVIYSKSGILGEIEVKDIKYNTVRQLLINKIVQTEMNLNDFNSNSEYIQMIDDIVPYQAEASNALVLGLGGGLLANLLELKNFDVDGVEFDPRIIESAKNYFYLNKRVDVYCRDARYFINSCTKSYKLVVFDLFKAEEQPSHTITIESLNKVREMLSADGTIIINWHGYTKKPLGEGTQILINTIKCAGFEVDTLSRSADEDHRNILIIGRKSENNQGFVNRGLINTDDKPMLEMANARANLRWRSNYLRFYQGEK